MRKNYIFLFCFIGLFFSGNTQEAVLCPVQTVEFYIEDISDVPTITTNDDGTITLTHPEQYITDIFSNHIIYDFYRTYPSSTSEALKKAYTIGFKSKDLIVNLLENVPLEVFKIYDENSGDLEIPINSTLNPIIVDALDNKTFRLVGMINDGESCYGDCPFNEVPEAFKLDISFNYDEENSILNVETVNETPCGNTFSIGLQGGNPAGIPNSENTLQLWESRPNSSSTSNTPDDCSYFEFILFNVFNVGCEYYSYGNIDFIKNTSENYISFGRSNFIFGYDTLRFTEANLSVNDFGINKMYPFQAEGNPYLQLLNSENKTLCIEISNLSGQIVSAKKRVHA